MNQYTYSSNPRPNEVAFTSTLEFVTSLNIQLTNTLDRTLPSNLKLEIFGCFQPNDTLVTKAQIESIFIK